MEFNALLMRVYASTLSISAFAVRNAANRSVWFGFLVFGHQKSGRTRNINSNRTSSLGAIVSLISLILMRSICLSSNDLCSVFRMLKKLQRGLWYRSPRPIS